MHRQVYDLQLAQYDDRGWRATFYTTKLEHSPTSSDGHRVGSLAVARDAAGGVGGMAVKSASDKLMPPVVLATGEGNRSLGRVPHPSESRE